MAERIEAIKITLNESLNEKGKPWTKALDLAEEKSGVPRLYLVLGKCANDDKSIISTRFRSVCEESFQLFVSPRLSSDLCLSQLLNYVVR